MASIFMTEDITFAVNVKGLEAMRAASMIAEENGIAEMTLDEINAEIAEARHEDLHQR